MASTEGLTRRRGGTAAHDGEDEDVSSRATSPNPKGQPSPCNDLSSQTIFNNSENGHKIAFDPRDMGESVERSKQPRLTLMEEVLLLGLKDTQVRKG